MSFLKDYQKLYDNFTQTRRLDDNDSSWTDAQRLEFKAAYRRLEIRWGQINKALSRLEMLPSPTAYVIDDPTRFVQAPWPTAAQPDINKSTLQTSLTTVHLDELIATDPHLTRAKIEKHINADADGLTTNGHYALVVVKNGDKIIVDGHHRLMAQWLLGHPTARVWLVEEK